MATINPDGVLPTTRSGALGAILAVVSVAGFALAVALDSPTTGRIPFAVTWLIVVASGALELFAIIRRGERAPAAFAALLPFALLVGLLVMEATGGME